MSDIDLIQDAQGLRATLREAAPRHEAARRLAPELSAELGARGYYRMLVPRSRGGLEIEAPAFVEVLEALAEGDAATAWCVMTGATTGLLAAYLPPEGAATLLSEPSIALAGVFAPMGKATIVDGGYRLSGRWTFCSGCENAAWRSGGALVLTEHGPRQTPEGAPEIRSMFFQAAASQVIDTWNVAGLCGTGSHDVEVKDVFVPESLTTCLTHDRPVAGALYRMPPFALLALGVGAVALGIGRAALDEATRQVQAPRKMGKPKAADSHVQTELGKAEAMLRAAQALVRSTMRDVGALAQRPEPLALRERALLRMAASHAADAATAAVDTAYAIGGGAAIYRTNALQRHHRDIHTLTQHIMVAPAAARLAGRAWLEQPGDFSVL